MEEVIAAVVKEQFGLECQVVLTHPEPQFGDYATNVALQLAKPVGKPPREIAEAIAATLRESGDFTEVTVAGPGFINIRLSDDALWQQMSQAPAPVYAGVRYVVEYSCPNAFKELHTGHLYVTIAGDIIARLIEQSGGEVHRTSFGGDVGLHVAKCLWGIREALGGELPDKLTEVAATPFARARWISECYVAGAGAYESSDEAKQTIDELNKTIYGFHSANDHESPLAQIYWVARQWSFDYFAAFYALIQVDSQHYYPESQTAEPGMAVVREQLAKGNLRESDGAIVYDGDEMKHLHTRVFVTSKGLPTYETKDIGVIWLEKQDYNFDKRLLITGNDQTEYMRVVFAAAQDFRPELAGTMTHLTNGTVRFGDGAKMSSRLGNVTRAVDVIDAVREKVRSLVTDESQIEPVTLGAIKYLFAKYRLGGDIAFDLEETVSLQGNSGPYLQYAHARACSIIEKSNVLTEVTDHTLDDAERALVRILGQYGEVVERAASELMPHYICTYLYELAQEFNRFYEKCRIIGDDREALRLALVMRYRDTLANGLSLLGITAPTRM